MGYAKVRITAELLTEMLTEGWSGDNLTCVQGLPSGARFACAMFDHQDVALVYEHMLFRGGQRQDDNWPGTLPEVTVVFHRDYPPEDGR